jgi:hypothetical protein
LQKKKGFDMDFLQKYVCGGVFEHPLPRSACSLQVLHSSETSFFPLLWGDGGLRQLLQRMLARPPL